MFHIDNISMILTVDTDLTIVEIESRLNREGYTLGYFHPPKNQILLEEGLSRCLPNLHSLYYGELSDLCVALRLEDHEERVVQTRRVPRQATGPGWKNLILGSERKWGLIYLADLKIFHRPSMIQHTLFSVSCENESFEIEREMKKHELVPLAFGRFSKGRLRPFLKLLHGEFFLLLEWAGSHEEVREILHQLEPLFRRRKNYQIVETSAQKLKLARALRWKMPEVGWGGETLPQPEGNVLELEKEILECLR